MSAAEFERSNSAELRRPTPKNWSAKRLAGCTFFSRPGHTPIAGGDLQHSNVWRAH
jgi:hypothetical protein